jgi:hypothetical protein
MSALARPKSVRWKYLIGKALAGAFLDAAYFTRFFTRETGSVPTRFRASRNG